MYISFFDQLTKRDVSIAGGKGSSLGEMTHAGIPIPPGFVVTTHAFSTFYKNELTKDFKNELMSAFSLLNTERVAVRSSAVAEDSKTSSWAGQLESYLNVTKEDLIKNVQKCWDSILSTRALTYAKDHEISEDDLKVAVVVQRMIDSECSGVLFSKNPVTGDKNELVIESSFGLGEAVVQGMVTPDNYIFDKKKLLVKEFNNQIKERMVVFKNGMTIEIDISLELQDKASLTEEQIIELAKIGLRIEKHYGFAVDVEWALEKGIFYIVQSRPITT